MTHITCRLTAKNRDQLRNPTLGNRVWATFFIFSKLFYKFSIQSPHLSDAVSQKFLTIYFSTMTMHAPGIFQLNAMISALQIIVASIVSEETRTTTCEMLLTWVNEPAGSRLCSTYMHQSTIKYTRYFTDVTHSSIAYLQRKIRHTLHCIHYLPYF